jgi:hypothetical protein
MPILTPVSGSARKPHFPSQGNPPARVSSFGRRYEKLLTGVAEEYAPELDEDDEASAAS